MFGVLLHLGFFDTGIFLESVALAPTLSTSWLLLLLLEKGIGGNLEDSNNLLINGNFQKGLDVIFGEFHDGYRVVPGNNQILVKIKDLGRVDIL